MYKPKYLQPRVRTGADTILHLKTYVGLVTTSTLFDYSLNNHPGTLKGTAALKYPGCELDGDSDYIEVADHADFSFGDGTDDSPFSTSVWVYIDNIGGYSPIVGKWATDNREWYLELYTGKVTFYILGEGSIYRGRYCNTRLSIGQWYHIVATYDGRGGASAQDGIKIYVDGARKDDTDDVNLVYTAMSDGTAPVWIGRGDIDYANGLIDDVMIFNVEKSASEVKSIYEVTRRRYGV